MARRTARDERRRRLGQNFLRPRAADRFIAGVDPRPGELFVEIGAGSGVLTRALAERGGAVVAVEVDAVWSDRLRQLSQDFEAGRIQVVERDILQTRLPAVPYRAVGCLPFGASTAILRKLFDDPETPLTRADLILQWEVARKRAAAPPTTLLSTTWAPWWEFRLGAQIPPEDFRPVPRVAGGVLVATRRPAAVLPASMSAPYANFVRDRWPFG